MKVFILASLVSLPAVAASDDFCMFKKVEKSLLQQEMRDYLQVDEVLIFNYRLSLDSFAPSNWFHAPNHVFRTFSYRVQEGAEYQIFYNCDSFYRKDTGYLYVGWCDKVKGKENFLTLGRYRNFGTLGFPVDLKNVTPCR